MGKLVDKPPHATGQPSRIPRINFPVALNSVLLMHCNSDRVIICERIEWNMPLVPAPLRLIYGSQVGLTVNEKYFVRINAIDGKSERRRLGDIALLESLQKDASGYPLILLITEKLDCLDLNDQRYCRILP
jgi:hypothetical protein